MCFPLATVLGLVGVFRDEARGLAILVAVVSGAFTALVFAPLISLVTCG